MSPVPFVDVRNITSATSPRFKKGIDALVKQSRHAINTGKSTLGKEIKVYEQFINREKNSGKPATKPNSLKKKTPRST